MSTSSIKALIERLLATAATRRRVLAAGAAAAGTLAALPGPALAAPPVNTLKPGLLGGRGDVAILGHDTVAYFTLGKAVRGRDEFTHEWMGAKWKFASQAHLDLFKADPARYAPQYGGYCAYGVSRGYLVKIEPEQFRIVDGRLYLNYDASVQAEWLKDVAGHIRRADAQFEALLRQ
ncbi:MAG: hypothetical protein KIT17_19995 [Rubrivivax sp.]|nr:hypothetical protein [Rubrivivax sp.]